MKYISKILWAAAAIAATPLLFSCSSTKNQHITVTDAPMALTPNLNNEVELDFEVNVPAKYVPTRSRVYIEPALIIDGNVEQMLDPIILDSPIYDKKMHRKKVIYGFNDPYASSAYKMSSTSKAYTARYKNKVGLKNTFDNGSIIAYVSVDGCGQCTGADTILIADLSNLSSLIESNFATADWIEPAFKVVPKTHFGKSEARLQFEINKSDILMNLANNAEEMQKMLKTLTPVLKDSLSTLNRLSINGSASAEGRYDKNVKLAADRATSARNWLNDQFHLTNNQLKKIKIGSQPEGWLPVVAAMHAAGDPDSALVKKIALEYPDLKTGEAEKHIRKLQCWPRIAERYLAKDRRVIYEYEWTVRSFNTDEEMLYMYERRPDAFNEDEFLRVATLKTTPAEKTQVYETMLSFFPDNEVALNNLAILYFNSGKYNKAIDLLGNVDKPTEEMVTTLAACYAALEDDQSAMKMLENINNPQATYILGVLEAKNNRMTDAYYNLAAAQDINTAITALSIGNNTEAWSIMSELDDNSPKAYYVRAIAATRLGMYDEAIENIEIAIRGDNALKNRAATEPDFRPLHNNENFNKIIN